MKSIIFIHILFFNLCFSFVQAKALEDYVPVLENVKENAFSIDPGKGYLVKQLKPNVYLLTDGVWQSAFVTTGKGVVLLDAPQSYGQHIVQAVAETTDEPIKMLIYSHTHVDHIGGSEHLRHIKGLTIVASKKMTHFLKEKVDPRRLIPTKTYSGNYKVRLGSELINLDHHGDYHSNESDVFIYMPKRKFLMVIDSLAPGYVPFKGFDLTSNFHEYRKIFDEILGYEFDVIVGGHLSQIGTAKDVRLTQQYVEDVYETVKRVHAETNLGEIMAQAAEVVGWDNKYLLFKVFLDHIVEVSAREIEERWIEKLAGVDVFVDSHAFTALQYVRWDD